jgi:hypothetical protein
VAAHHLVYVDVGVFAANGQVLGIVDKADAEEDIMGSEGRNGGLPFDEKGVFPRFHHHILLVLGGCEVAPGVGAIFLFIFLMVSLERHELRVFGVGS